MGKNTTIYNDHFMRSLNNWFKEAEDHSIESKTLNISLDKQLRDFNYNSKKDGSKLDLLYRSVVKCMILQKFTSCFDEVLLGSEECIDECERNLFFSLVLVARNKCLSISIPFDDEILGDQVDLSYGNLVIEPNKTIGKLRFSFLLTYEYDGNITQHDKKFDAGHFHKIRSRFSKKMIIECGNSKKYLPEIYNSNKDRDRFVESMGYIVIRHKRKDIIEDPFGCALKALSVLEVEIEKDKFVELDD